jgi:DNA mismatch repair protein MutL
VLNISVNHGDVDANVHPTKTEVRFVNDRAVFSTVHLAVKNALLNHSKPIVHESQTYEQIEGNLPSLVAQVPPLESVTLSSEKAQYIAVNPVVPIEPVSVEFKYINPDSFVKKVSNPHNSPVNENVLIERECEQIKVLGELFSTYILCEYGEELILIDKHAADERLRFNRLKRELKSHSQLLIEPVEVAVGADLAHGLLEAADELGSIGLQIEAGSESAAVRVVAMPTILERVQLENALESVKFGELFMVDEVLNRIACRTAIKGGDKSDSVDIERLAQRVLTDSRLQYCPHGRPITVRISRRELEKKFKRLL